MLTCRSEVTGDFSITAGHLLLPALAAHVRPHPAVATRGHRVTTTAGSRVVPLASSDPGVVPLASSDPGVVPLASGDPQVVPLSASASTGATVTRSLPPSPPCRKVLGEDWQG